MKKEMRVLKSDKEIFEEIHLDVVRFGNNGAVEKILYLLMTTRVENAVIDDELKNLKNKVEHLENRLKISEKRENSPLYNINFILKICEERWGADRETIKNEISNQLGKGVNLETIKAASKLSNSTESLRRNILLISRSEK